jgi:hypothetical protein
MPVINVNDTIQENGNDVAVNVTEFTAGEVGLNRNGKE